MRSIFDFVIQPKKSRYQNTKQVGDKELIINTEIFNHQYVSREATVIATPTTLDTPIQVGDDVVVHHNIFRRWHNVKGIEKNSRKYISEDTYLCQPEQVYLHKRNGKWTTRNGFCFVQPLEKQDMLGVDKEKQ